jgi:hypothetical protein
MVSLSCFAVSVLIRGKKMHCLLKIFFTIVSIAILCFPSTSLSQNCYDYNNTTDNLKAHVSFDGKMDTEFFRSYKASYPWYIIRNDDGTFENTLGEEVSEEDKIPIEHAAHCVSTHQGKHVMDFCDATYDAGTLRLEIYGGLPAYASSLMIIVKGPEFFCRFRASYPALVSNCKWNILSKKLIFRDKAIEKGQRLYAWLSVQFEEISTYQGKTTTMKYKIEGYIKPIVK